MVPDALLKEVMSFFLSYLIRVTPKGGGGRYHRREGASATPKGEDVKHHDSNGGRRKAPSQSTRTRTRRIKQPKDEGRRHRDPQGEIGESSSTQRRE